MGPVALERGEAKAKQRREPAVRLRVLVADEQEIVHWGFRSLLTAQDWVERYIGAQTAEEALELVRAHEPHVAMIDVMVGDDSGAALARSWALQSFGTEPNAPAARADWAVIPPLRAMRSTRVRGQASRMLWQSAAPESSPTITSIIATCGSWARTSSSASSAVCAPM